MWHTWGRKNCNWKILREDPDINGMIILKWISKKQCVRRWTGIIWLRIKSSGGML
jgi:hypothetical protein